MSNLVDANERKLNSSFGKIPNDYMTPCHVLEVLQTMGEVVAHCRTVPESENVCYTITTVAAYINLQPPHTLSHRFVLPLYTPLEFSAAPSGKGGARSEVMPTGLTKA